MITTISSKTFNMKKLLNIIKDFDEFDWMNVFAVVFFITYFTLLIIWLKP